VVFDEASAIPEAIWETTQGDRRQHRNHMGSLR
jgi:hypothetical protein